MGKTILVTSSGQLVHGQSFTITGSGFGTKSRGLAPLLDDHGQAMLGAVDAQWTGGSNGGYGASYTTYNNVLRATSFNPTGAAVGAPHPFVSAIYGGAHYGDHIPWDVYLCRIITLPTLPCVLYARWYEIADSNSSLTQAPNLKFFNYNNADPSVSPNTCMTFVMLGSDTVTPFDNVTSTYQIDIGDNNFCLEKPDRNGHGVFWNQELNPYKASYGWKLVEVEMCIDQTTGSSGHGYVQRLANGTLSVDYAGRTDIGAGTTRYVSVGVGNYTNDSGNSGSNAGAAANFEYTIDHRIDMTAGSVTGHCARVIWGDAVTLAASVIRSYTNITAWSNTSISGIFWKDKFTSGQTTHAHVVTESSGVLDNQFTGVVA